MSIEPGRKPPKKAKYSEKRIEEQMANKIIDRESARIWQQQYESKAPQAGDMAPDFELSDSDGLHSIRLSSFRGHKPVALIFGSFT